MYDTWQVGASELRDLETRLIHRVDQVDAKWQHRFDALAVELRGEQRFQRDCLQFFLVSVMIGVNVLIWGALMWSIR